MTLAIETRGLRKEFGRARAVNNLSLEVPPGEIFGFLGPNGAGKSTSIKMLLGLVHPTGGEAAVLGAPAGDVATRRRIGFLPEDFRFYDWLTASELLTFHGRLCEMSHERLRTRVPEVLELVGLAPHAHRRLRGFSKGMLQRVGLAQAIVHEPELIFLDEPTSGLDPIGRRMVRDVLRAQRDRGATVFLNSHLLGEVEITCDRVVFIKEGEIVATENLRDRSDAEARILVSASNVSSEGIAGLDRWCTTVSQDGNLLSLGLRGADLVPEIVRHLVQSGADVHEVRPTRLALEELFVSIVGKDPGL